MSLGKKLNSLILLVVACLIISTVVTWSNLKQIDKNVNEALDERVVQIRLVDEIRVNIGMQGLYIRALFIANTAENQQLLEEYASKLDENIEQLSAFSLTADVKEEFERLKAANENFNAGYKTMLNELNNNEVEQATNLLINELKVANLTILDAATNILTIQNDALNNINEQANHSIANAKLVSIIFIVISLIIAGCSMYFIQKGIIRPLNVVMQAATKISTRNLHVDTIDVRTKDEIGQLAAIFNTMKDALRELVGEVQKNTQQLQEASQELSASTEEISASTEEVTSQAALAADNAIISAQAATDSARAMDETAKGVQAISEASQHLHYLSDETKTTASNGTAIISIAKNQMAVISTSTEQVNTLVMKLAQQTAEIESISKGISAITDQTNLLALNASIEAARAGEHGKGFAVVADEVKKLASESKQSALLINALTIDIQQDTKNVQHAVESALTSVDDGVKFISNAGQSFEHIVQDIEKMSTQITEVSSTAEQLNANAEEVAASTTEIANASVTASDGLTSIAAAMEQQSATMNAVNDVAIQLNESAVSLQQQVEQFKL